MTERCVCCGEEIPEGRQICLKCEETVFDKTNVVYNPEHEAMMCRNFKDRPCMKCRKIACNFRECKPWRTWFANHWHRIKAAAREMRDD